MWSSSEVTHGDKSGDRLPRRFAVMTRGVLGRKDGERMSGSSRSRGRALRADASPPCLTPAPKPISRRATVHVFAELVQLPAAGPQDSAVASRMQPTGRCSALRRARSGRHPRRDADCIAKGMPLVCLPSLFPPPFSIIKKRLPAPGRSAALCPQGQGGRHVPSGENTGVRCPFRRESRGCWPRGECERVPV